MGHTLRTQLRTNRPGIHEYELNLAALYPTQAARNAFEARWRSFLDATQEDHTIFTKHDDTLSYQTESFLAAPDSRPRVLLLLGNPACQSVRAGMCFAHERGGGEHRFWRALKATKWLAFSSNSNDDRRTALLTANYDAPLQIGIDVFHTFPSPASAPRWSGVTGIRSLFGNSALRDIARLERDRVRQLSAAFDAIITFQRDAYEELRASHDQPYDIRRARGGALRSTSNCRPVLGAPPTRFAHTTAFRVALSAFRDQLKRELQ
jgi:hypothetical protein